MKKLVVALLLVLGLILGASQVQAITLSLADVSAFTQLGSSDPGTITVNNGLIPAGTAVTFTTIFVPPQSGLQEAGVGKMGLGLGFNPGDLFQLGLKNTNENVWLYRLVAVTTQGNFSTGFVPLAPDTHALFSANLGGAAGTVTSAFFMIRGAVPFPDGDRTAEYEIAPTPEPGTLALLGMGLVAIQAVRARARRRTRV